MRYLSCMQEIRWAIPVSSHSPHHLLGPEAHHFHGDINSSHESANPKIFPDSLARRASVSSTIGFWSGLRLWAPSSHRSQKFKRKRPERGSARFFDV